MIVLATLQPGELLKWVLVLGFGCLLFVGLVVGAISLLAHFAPQATASALKPLATFTAVVVGIIVLTVIFLLLVNDAGTQANFDNAMKAAALVIAPLSTFIGFVAGQSAGSEAASKAASMGESAQKLGEKVAERADEKLAAALKERDEARQEADDQRDEAIKNEQQAEAARTLVRLYEGTQISEVVDTRDALRQNHEDLYRKAGLM